MTKYGYMQYRIDSIEDLSDFIEYVLNKRCYTWDYIVYLMKNYIINVDLDDIKNNFIQRIKYHLNKEVILPFQEDEEFLEQELLKIIFKTLLENLLKIIDAIRTHEIGDIGTEEEIRILIKKLNSIYYIIDINIHENQLEKL
jgi:hypothetical protein